MRKFINNVLMLAAAFFAGTATVSVIEYANSIADRPDNSIGGAYNSAYACNLIHRMDPCKNVFQYNSS